MNNSIDDFEIEKTCVYNEETYSVRDNGAVMRHPRENWRKRDLDTIWTFGKMDPHKGYLFIAGVQVHRIVATAFIGEAPSKSHVVDHINTNKQDNRPENLRWVTKLENILLNPITCRKIMLKTGKTIDYVLQHPEILHETDLSPDISWMRTVTKEESHNCYENMLHWANDSDIKPSEKRGTIGEWIYQKRFFSENNMDNHLVYTETKNAVHNKNRIKLPSEYPCCPTSDEGHTLQEYYENLKEGAIFFKNKYATSYVKEAAIYKDKIIVRTESNNIFATKPWHVTIIHLENNAFVHDLFGSYFEELGSEKYFTVLQEKEWTGDEVFDDYC